MRLRIAAISLVLVTACSTRPPEQVAVPSSNELPEDVLDLLAQKQYRTALPHIELLAHRRNQHATFVLANYYVCGKMVPFSCAKAEELFTSSLDSKNGLPSIPAIARSSKNEIAWINAACEQPGFTRNLGKAMQYSREAVSEDGEPYSVDTFAAVLARTGEFARAATAQRLAIARLAEFSKTEDVPKYTFDEFNKRLSLYEQGKPAQFDDSTYKQNCNALPD
jgi:hypothetical protein